MSNLLLGFVDVYPKRKRMRRQVPTSSWTCQSGLLPPRLLPFTWTHWDGKYIIKYMKIHENASKYMENTWKYMKSWKYMNISSLRFHPLHARFLEFLRTADLDPSRSLASPWSLQDAVYKHIYLVCKFGCQTRTSFMVDQCPFESIHCHFHGKKKTVGPNLDLSPSFLMTEALWTEAAAPATSGSTP